MGVIGYKDSQETMSLKWKIASELLQQSSSSLFMRLPDRIKERLPGKWAAVLGFRWLLAGDTRSLNGQPTGRHHDAREGNILWDDDEFRFLIILDINVDDNGREVRIRGLVRVGAEYRNAV